VRSKIKYEAAATETGKMKVSKIGLKPIMREDFEYEVLTALHFDEDHKVTVVKDNTQIFEDSVLMTPDYGIQLHNYLEKGVDVNLEKRKKQNDLIGTIDKFLEKYKDNKKVSALMTMIDQQAKRKYGILSWKDLPGSSLDGMYERLRKEVEND
jgi:hypothetical protein